VLERIDRTEATHPVHANSSSSLDFRPYSSWRVIPGFAPTSVTSHRSAQASHRHVNYARPPMHRPLLHRRSPVVTSSPPVAHLHHPPHPPRPPHHGFDTSPPGPDRRCPHRNSIWSRGIFAQPHSGQADIHDKKPASGQPAHYPRLVT